MKINVHQISASVESVLQIDKTYHDGTAVVVGQHIEIHFDLLPEVAIHLDEGNLRELLAVLIYSGGDAGASRVALDEVGTMKKPPAITKPARSAETARVSTATAAIERGG